MDPLVYSVWPQFQAFLVPLWIVSSFLRKVENIFNEYFTSKSILENRILYNCVEVSGVVKAGPDRARA